VSTNGGGTLAGYQVQGPPGWCGVSLVDGEAGDLQAAARAVTASDDAAALCQRFLERLVLQLRDQALAGFAVWVPQPETGVPSALLTVGVLVSDPGSRLAPEEYARRKKSAPAAPGEIRRTVEVLEVAAGPAVRLAAFGADESGALEENLTWTVFPPGTDEALQVVVTTEELHLAAEVFAAVDEMVDAMTVEVTGG
jgi:hypothetical protein